MNRRMILLVCVLLVPVTLIAALASAVRAANDAAAKRVVFIAGSPSHGYGAHEHNAGCLLLAKELQAAMPSIKCDVVQNGWPADESILSGADCIVM
jgi:hypothetical protein